MNDKLLKLREKLIAQSTVSEEYSTLSIGDFVNLIDNNTPIYSDILMNNIEHSYYGTSEIRLIQEIIMKKDEIIINVNHMDDYEMLTNMGYQTIGYTLVNQYSFMEDGSIESELRCKKESVKKINP